MSKNEVINEPEFRTFADIEALPHFKDGNDKDTPPIVFSVKRPIGGSYEFINENKDDIMYSISHSFSLLSWTASVYKKKNSKEKSVQIFTLKHKTSKKDGSITSIDSKDPTLSAKLIRRGNVRPTRCFYVQDMAGNSIAFEWVKTGNFYLTYD
ncbi:hypothetical protein HK099_002618 [Clydaea vesicula]|uniref:Uncharacterized protein n=1 Tax=Clydaea vesicula TaxID=447962 RepID=A0AAD5U2H8_9FUNG|nr:hypothetical protein HK099_002618 [Clydaea vesicula]